MADVPENEAPVVHFSVADLKDARERSELSLIARIFWDELHDLRMPLAYHTVDIGRKLLEPLGEVERMGYLILWWQARKFYVKDRECARTNLMFNPDARNSWMCITPHLDEEELTGPTLHRQLTIRPSARRGRGGLPPSVSAGLSSNLERQWTRARRLGGLGIGGASRSSARDKGKGNATLQAVEEEESEDEEEEENEGEGEGEEDDEDEEDE
ncbi:hypothetical protein LINPERPRIM_LOCUS35730 [Linum perenne]